LGLKGFESCKIVFLEEHFLFTCSDTFAVKRIVYSFSYSGQSDRQMERDKSTLPIADLKIQYK